MPKGGCQNRLFGTDFDWGILNPALYKMIDIFTYTLEIFKYLIIRYAYYKKIPLFYVFCSDMIAFAPLIFIVL